MIGVAEEHEKVALSTGLVKEVLEAPTDDAAEKYIKMVPTSNPALPGECHTNLMVTKLSLCIMLL
jgi:hypothetical protein